MSGPRTAVQVLAIARLASLITTDEISRPVREWLLDWSKDSPEYSLPERISTMASCLHCSSVWAAAVILTANRLPLGRALVAVLAGSQAAILTAALLNKLEQA